MTTSARARQLAHELNAKHTEAGGSWRKVQKLYYPSVNFATLNRIAKSEGEWLPRDRKIRAALGLTRQRETTPHERRVGRKIATMAKKTRDEVLNHDRNNESDL
jgi:hypothetical protein